MNGYYSESSNHVNDSVACKQDTIPMILDKANESLTKSMVTAQRVFKILFGDEPMLQELPKPENITQSAFTLAERAAIISESLYTLAERLGA